MPQTIMQMTVKVVVLCLGRRRQSTTIVYHDTLVDTIASAEIPLEVGWRIIAALVAMRLYHDRWDVVRNCFISNHCIGHVVWLDPQIANITFVIVDQ